MKIVTHINGTDEVANHVRRGDVIVTGSQREQYAIDAGRFTELYNVINGVATPQPNPRKVAKVTKRAWNTAIGHKIPSIVFKSSWGEDMILQPNDYIVKEAPGSFYRVAASAFRKTYRRV